MGTANAPSQSRTKPVNVTKTGKRPGKLWGRNEGTMQDKPLLIMKDLALNYGIRQVFSGLNLEVKPGEVVGILGQNGAGKTTLLKAVLGAVKPSVGTIYRDPETKISYLPQHGRFPKSVQIRGKDVVYLGLEGAKLGFWAPRGTREKVNRAIAAVGAEAYADAPISGLSGGELQRLRIAAAIVERPDLLVVDEPLASLDIKHQQDIVKIFADLAATGTAILLVTHELNPVQQLLDKVVYIAMGHAAVGSVAEVMSSETLSKLYGEDVEVINLRGAFFVVGGSDNKTGGFVEEALHGHHHASHFESAESPHNPKEAGH